MKLRQASAKTQSKLLVATHSTLTCEITTNQSSSL
jgi:hypothetical protein